MRDTIKIEDFCAAMETWARVCQEPLETDSAVTAEWRRQFTAHWSFMRLAITKSCLLDRLIYGGETLRTKLCPEHRGRWGGISSPACACDHGASEFGEHTGWLKNPSDLASSSSGPVVMRMKE
jgi:hypothetical protein